MCLITIKQLTKSYGATNALNGLSLKLDEGQIYGIVGPDGAGKTTLLRILCGILTPDSGQVFISGIDVLKKPEKVKPHLGYMAQQFALYRDLTVLENITFFGDLFGVPRRQMNDDIERLLRFSRLWDFKDRPAKNLSGGMKQKLALCCTLIHTPRLLLLDEPTTGVDPVSRHEFYEMLRPLPAQGTTVVISTGYMDEAERCNRVALLHNGVLLIEDTPDNLRHALTGKLYEIRCEQLRTARKSLAKLPGVRDIQLFGDRLHLNYQGKDELYDLTEKIKNQLSEQSWSPSQIREISPRLEDVFMELMVSQ